MVQSLSIKNFFSIDEEVKLDFRAGSNKFAEEFQVVQLNDEEHTRILRLGILYGYTGTGKSNMLKAFELLYRFINCSPQDEEVIDKVRPFQMKENTRNSPSCFELVYFVDDIKYCYSLGLDSKRVHYENLEYFKDGRWNKLFDRNLAENTPNNNGHFSVHAETEIITPLPNETNEVGLGNNKFLFLGSDKETGFLQLVNKAKVGLRNCLLGLITPTTYLTKCFQYLSYKDKSLVPLLLGFIKANHFNITNIETIPVKISKDFANKANKYKVFFEKSEKYFQSLAVDFYKRKSTCCFNSYEYATEVYKTVIYHQDETEEGNPITYTLPLVQESCGTLRVLGLMTALYQTIQKEGFLAIDEMDNSLHSKLFQKMLFEFLNNQTKSQLLISTHNDGLLDLVNDLIRMDSVWFVTKKKTGATDLYKLTDFRGVNKLSSIREAYRNNRFGI